MKYIGCLSKLGSKTVTGPITGKRWEILKTGTWVDDSDAAEIVNMDISFYCLRLQRTVMIKPFFYANPTQDAIKKIRR